jgi:hypothetical protein
MPEPAENPGTNPGAAAILTVLAGRENLSYTDPGGRTAVIHGFVLPAMDRDGNIAGVAVSVRCYAADGTEEHIDPDRRFINPPTAVIDPTIPVTIVEWPDGTIDEILGTREDPEAAFVEMLWDSINNVPNPQLWREP